MPSAPWLAVGQASEFVLRSAEAALRDAPRPGVNKTITQEMVAEVVRKTLEEKPADAMHWSLRSMAAASEVSRSSVHTIWKAFNLQPHRVETLKLSADPNFVEKTRDIVGLYMSPPANAVVISVDEKSQMQAMDRTQSLLPIRPGTPEGRTHDYHRHGTSSLFAGLLVKTGVVIRQCHRCHRHQEFIKFLNATDEVVKATEPEGTAVHLVLDNYATHKTPAVRRWLERHPEYHLHFTPTSASWLNQVERVFADLTQKQLRRGVFTSVAALEKAALAYIDARNDDAKPFVWTADANTILGRGVDGRKTAYRVLSQVRAAQRRAEGPGAGQTPCGDPPGRLWYDVKAPRPFAWVDGSECVPDGLSQGP